MVGKVIWLGKSLSFTVEGIHVDPRTIAHRGFLFRSVVDGDSYPVVRAYGSKEGERPTDEEMQAILQLARIRYGT